MSSWSPQSSPGGDSPRSPAGRVASPRSPVTKMSLKEEEEEQEEQNVDVCLPLQPLLIVRDKLDEAVWEFLLEVTALEAAGAKDTAFMLCFHCRPSLRHCLTLRSSSGWAEQVELDAVAEALQGARLNKRKADRAREATRLLLAAVVERNPAFSPPEQLCATTDGLLSVADGLLLEKFAQRVRDGVRPPVVASGGGAAQYAAALVSALPRMPPDVLEMLMDAAYQSLAGRGEGIDSVSLFAALGGCGVDGTTERPYAAICAQPIGASSPP